MAAVKFDCDESEWKQMLFFGSLRGSDMMAIYETFHDKEPESWLVGTKSTPEEHEAAVEAWWKRMSSRVDEVIYSNKQCQVIEYVKQIEPGHNVTYRFDLAELNFKDEGCTFQPKRGEITWRLLFHVLKETSNKYATNVQFVQDATFPTLIHLVIS